jgi:hypothetical protein
MRVFRMHIVLKNKISITKTCRYRNLFILFGGQLYYNGESIIYDLILYGGQRIKLYRIGSIDRVKLICVDL